MDSVASSDRLAFQPRTAFRKRLYDLRRHVGPSQSFQRLDHQTRHVRQTRDFLVGSMLKFQLGGIPLIGLIRTVADVGPDRRYLCRDAPAGSRAVFPHGAMVQW